jgi:hypothetical protein
MQLREFIEMYLGIAGGYGEPVPLVSFGLSRDDTERVFGIFDEDYHISRFLHFRNTSGESYSIDGFPQTHVSVDAEIQTIL